MRAPKFSFIVVVVLISGCQGWQQIPRPAADSGLQGSPGMIKVTRTMGCGSTPSRACMERRGTLTLHNPRIQGDSLIGYYDPDNRERVAIPIADVTNVEAKKVDKLRTVGAVAGGALAAVAVVSVLAAIALLAALN